MTRPKVEEGLIEGFVAIAAAMGCHERTARRWAKHPDPKRRVKVAIDPFGNAYSYPSWIREWATRNTRPNSAA